jgi:hypothetical protein
MEAAVAIRSVMVSLVIHEVPSYERDRIHGSSDLHAVRDGSRVLREEVSKNAHTP